MRGRKALNLIARLKIGTLLLALALAWSGCESTGGGYSGGAASGGSGLKGFEVRFGLMTVPQGGFPFIYDETRHMQRFVDPTYAHGFTIVKKGGGRFFYSYSVTFPEPISGLPESFLRQGQLSRDKRTYTRDSQMVWDAAFESFYFSEDDPLGTYEMSVYIDGQLANTFSYEVEAVESGF